MKSVFFVPACGIMVLTCAFLILSCLTAPPARQLGDQPHIERTAIVDRVIDGDTICLQGGERVRLVGINAPEIRKDDGPGREAKEFLENLCRSGKEIGLDVDDLEPTDRYGRILAVVYMKANDTWVNLNAELLRGGYAEIMLVSPSEFNPYEWTGQNFVR
jgi:endonuclease YncB( thermonuclease family)